MQATLRQRFFSRDRQGEVAMTVSESTAEFNIPAAFRRVNHGFSFSVGEAQSRLEEINGPIIDSEEKQVNGSMIEFERRSQDAAEETPLNGGIIQFARRPEDAAGDPAGDETSRTLFVLHLHAHEIRTFTRPLAAQAYIEELINSGVDPQEIQAFEGSSLMVQVSFKPVVSLGTDVEAE